MQLKPGFLLQGGKYRIERVLGQGGFGITYEVTHTIFEKRMAIKEFFYKDYCEREESTSHVSLGTQNSRDFVERFMGKFVKEARMISQFDHPNIIHIHDIFHEHNTAYYVMDFIEGDSLSEIVHRRGALPEQEALNYIRQAAAALEFIHGRNINHLDVKPANLMVRKDDGKVILIDFGLSKQYDAGGGQISTTPVGISQGYAPMEQYNAGGVSSFSPQADIYSLGATLYKLVTGQTPPQSNEVFNEGLPALPSHLSPSTVRAITESMRPGRKDRPQSVAEFVALLDDDIETGVVVVDRAAPVVSQKTPTSPIGKPKAQPEPKKKSTSIPESFSPLLKKWALPIAACLLGVIAIICWPQSAGVDINHEGEKVDTIALSENSAMCDSLKNDSLIALMSDSTITEPIAAESVQKKTISSPSASLVTSSSGVRAHAGNKKVETTPVNVQEVVEHIEVHADVQTEVASSSATGIINGHRYVDLGLSVKWADCNVGATSPSDFGDYFAWGEIEPKPDYTNKNSETYEKNFSDISGNSPYDVACAKWKGSWRLPTKAEMQELINKCNWTWDSQGGHNGYKVVGPSGNSIFLPATGYRDGSSLFNAEGFGEYWSSTPRGIFTQRACILKFNNNSKSVNHSSRGHGLSVRPVSN